MVKSISTSSLQKNAIGLSEKIKNDFYELELGHPLFIKIISYFKLIDNESNIIKDLCLEKLTKSYEIYMKDIKL